MRHDDANIRRILEVAESAGFAELLGTMHAFRFTGQLTLHFLNGAPQQADFGRPCIVRFPEHPANHKSAPVSTKSLDTTGPAPPFSTP